ncbi:MAG: DsbA family protein [Myxococcota bacterium]|nr:DsbA family protein [Myxococcota bacterium]
MRFVDTFRLLLVTSVVACTQSAPAIERDKVAHPKSTPESVDDESAAVATWEGGSISHGEVLAKVKAELITLEVDYLTQRYQAEQQALEGLLLERLFEAEASKRGLADGQALFDAEVTGTVSIPTDAEIASFYQVMKRQLRDRPLEEVRDVVASELMGRAIRERYDVFVGELKEKWKVELELPFPDMPRLDVGSDDDPSLGPADAPITIVQFAEFQCPYCSLAMDTVDELMNIYEGKIRMVYRDFPLSFHDRAIPAAVAANCAGVQGKYWEMHELLMANQRALSDDDLESYAAKLALNLSQWSTCLADPAQTQEVEADLEDGLSVGVSATPTFFVNGIQVSGAVAVEQFAAIIEQELDPQ